MMTTCEAGFSEVNDNMDGGEKTAQFLEPGKSQENMSTKSEITPW